MTVNKNDRVTSKSWWGEVMPWRAQRGGISSSSGWSGPRVVPKGEGDVCPHLDRGNNAYVLNVFLIKKYLAVIISLLSPLDVRTRKVHASCM